MNRFQAIFDHSAIGVSVTDVYGRLIEINRPYAEILGYEPAELVGKTYAEITHRDDIDTQRALLDRLIGGEIDDFQIEKRFIGKRGDVVWARLAVALLRDGSGQPQGSIDMVEDITERKRAEDALARSETHLRSIIETAPDGIITIDENGLIDSFSPAAERLFGYRAEEVIGENVRMLMPEPYRSEHDTYLARYRETGEKRIIGIGRIVVGRRRGGETFPMQLSVGEFSSSGQRFFTGLIHDVTAREKAERELRGLQKELIQATRLSTMGAMGSGIAHELNQPLTAVINYVQACRRLLSANRATEPEKIEALMDKAISQAGRAGEIVRRFRNFIARGETERRLERVNPIVEEASALAMSVVSTKGIQIQMHLSAGLPRVLVDKVQIQQVVLNLVRNAVEAMDDAPEKHLTISTIETNGEGVEVEIAVEDTGSGLAPSMADKLFDPFQTTKADGMGIGLSICRTIIDAHEGRIWAEANPGGGTVFRFTLPVIAEADGG